MKQAAAFCSLPFRHIKVRPNGDVSLCCYQKGALGNLFTQPFAEIWRSALAEDVRAAVLDGQLHPMCVGWGACPYLTKPRTPSPTTIDRDYPTFLEFDLPNTHCNIGGSAPTPDTACFMCPRSANAFDPDVDRTLELADRLRFLMPWLEEVRIQGTAEPFWKDRVFEVLERLGFDGFRQQCHFNTYTNGTVFTAERRRRFIALCPRSALFFSIDAATPATYRRIRRVNLFERVVENIRAFVRERTPTQRVEIANNLNLINLDEAVQMVEIAKDLGVDAVQFNPTHDGGATRDDFRHLRVGPDNCDRFAEAEAKITERAAALRMRVNFIRPLDLNLRPRSFARDPRAALRPPLPVVT